MCKFWYSFDLAGFQASSVQHFLKIDFADYTKYSVFLTFIRYSPIAPQLLWHPFAISNSVPLNFTTIVVPYNLIPTSINPRQFWRTPDHSENPTSISTNPAYSHIPRLFRLPPSPLTTPTMNKIENKIRKKLKSFVGLFLI